MANYINGKASLLNSGDKLEGGYVIEEFINGGGFAEVYRACQERLKTSSIAIKLDALAKSRSQFVNFVF